MSDIDQAFINAYAEPSTVIPPRYPASEIPRTDRSPQLRVFSQRTDNTTARFEHADPDLAARRAPHFSEVSEFRAGVSSHAATLRVDNSAGPTDELTLPSLVGDRRPLSSFSSPRPVPSTNFKPVFEVDEFYWPSITTDLIRSSRNSLIPVIEMLTSIAGEGKSLIGIAGAVEGVGVTTVALCLARLLAQSNKNIALVDGNFQRGNLGSLLGLEFDTGWSNVLSGQIPLAESAVTSLNDRLTVLPLGNSCSDATSRLASIQSSVIAGMLRYHHDLVLFDLGSADDRSQLEAIERIVEHCHLDAGIIVVPAGKNNVHTQHGLDKLQGVFGASCLGVIGNQAC